MLRNQRGAVGGGAGHRSEVAGGVFLTAVFLRQSWHVSQQRLVRELAAADRHRVAVPGRGFGVEAVGA